MKKEYRNVARTKKMIRAAFVELLGEKKNTETITVGELTERADIAKSTFYNHYEDVSAVAEEFEDELIDQLSVVFAENDQEKPQKYEDYLRKLTAFVKSNEDLYRKAVLSSNVRCFNEKLKTFIAKKVLEKNISLPFSQNISEKYVQIRFLTNAYVDTTVDYFRGTLDVTLDEINDMIIALLSNISVVAKFQS